MFESKIINLNTLEDISAWNIAQNLNFDRDEENIYEYFGTMSEEQVQSVNKYSSFKLKRIEETQKR